MIRVEIVCDSGTARTCHSKNGGAYLRPCADSDDPVMAKRQAVSEALRHGWVKRRQPMRYPSTAYVCPACQAQ